MENKKIEIELVRDIKNAERFFDRTGEGTKEAYKCIDNDIDEINKDTGMQNVFLYIPESDNDLYPIFLN
ncbi:MAG TPA: hypothetical protein VIH28_06870 [Ignavibacteriaceae bacterium]